MKELKINIINEIRVISHQMFKAVIQEKCIAKHDDHIRPINHKTRILGNHLLVLYFNSKNV